MPKKYGGRIAKAGEIQESTRVIINRKVTATGKVHVVQQKIKDVKPTPELTPEPSSSPRRGRSKGTPSATPHFAAASDRLIRQRIPVLAKPPQGKVAPAFAKKYPH